MENSPFRYRSYMYDTESGFYYLQSRYYDPVTRRFINADSQLNYSSGLTGCNLFVYCANNPVNMIDPTGEAWWHWVIGAAIVVGCAAAVVITAGGAAAAVTAVCLVANGSAAATTATTIAAGAFICSSVAYGTAVVEAAGNSESFDDFYDQGNWGTVAYTALGMIGGGIYGYDLAKSSIDSRTTSSGRGTQNSKVKAAIQKGQAMHKQMDYGPGTIKEVTIAPKCRVDGIDFNNRIIYELKPNNPQAISRGLSQLDRYTAAASQQYGGEWTGVLKLYD